MTRRWAPPTRFTLRRNTASINERFDLVQLFQINIGLNILLVVLFTVPNARLTTWQTGQLTDTMLYLRSILFGEFLSLGYTFESEIIKI